MKNKRILTHCDECRKDGKCKYQGDMTEYLKECVKQHPLRQFRCNMYNPCYVK